MCDQNSRRPLSRIAPNRTHVGFEDDARGCGHIGRCAFHRHIASEPVVRRHHWIEEEQQLHLTARFPNLLRDLQNNQTTQRVSR